MVASFLVPLGYLREHSIPTAGHGTIHRPPHHYKADFADPVRRIVIELDGPSHRSRRKLCEDRRKTEVLEALGWSVTRIVHAES